MEKTNDFWSYAEKRLGKEKVASIKREAALEKKALEKMQRDIAKLLKEYMKKNNLEFNDLGKLLHTSPARIARIQRGEANLTLASVARIFALVGRTPNLI